MNRNNEWNKTVKLKKKKTSDSIYWNEGCKLPQDAGKLIIVNCLGDYGELFLITYHSIFSNFLNVLYMCILSTDIAIYIWDSYLPCDLIILKYLLIFREDKSLRTWTFSWYFIHLSWNRRYFFSSLSSKYPRLTSVFESFALC